MIGTEDYIGSMRPAVIPRLCPEHNGGETYQNGYLNPFWDRECEISHRRELHKIKGIKAIIGWAEPERGGWIGLVRDDAGSVHRTLCIRSCQLDAIRAARSLVNVLRLEQMRKRSVYSDCYPTLPRVSLKACAA